MGSRVGEESGSVIAFVTCFYQCVCSLCEIANRFEFSNIHVSDLLTFMCECLIKNLLRQMSFCI